MAVCRALSLVRAGYGFLWNSASFGGFSANATHVEWVTEGSGMLDMWVTWPRAGRRGDRSDARSSNNPFHLAMGAFAAATGFPPPMPHFATGFWQSKNRYRSQAEVPPRRKPI
eukprot:945444-Pyramimonas_sp.AAC.1